MTLPGPAISGTTLSSILFVCCNFFIGYDPLFSDNDILIQPCSSMTKIADDSTLRRPSSRLAVPGRECGGRLAIRL